MIGGKMTPNTSAGLLPRAWQIFNHIMMVKIRPTTGMMKSMIIHTAIPATSSNGMSYKIGIQIRMPGSLPHFSQMRLQQQHMNRYKAKPITSVNKMTRTDAPEATASLLVDSMIVPFWSMVMV